MTSYFYRAGNDETVTTLIAIQNNNYNNCNDYITSKFHYILGIFT